MRSFLLSYVLLLLAPASVHLVLSKATCTQSNCEEVYNETESDEPLRRDESVFSCSVYLAPSSIPGGGMGMFTTKDVRRGGTILPSDGPSIPVIDVHIDYMFETGIIDESDYSRVREAWTNLFSGYWWESGAYDATMFESDFAVDYQITMGALPNSHPILDNLDVGNVGVVPYDDSMVKRDAVTGDVDPGAGAFSYYPGRKTLANRDMQAGEEIFLKYPPEYMDHICEIHNVPKRKDYEEAGNMLSKFLNLFEGKYMAFSDDGTPLVWAASEMVKSLLPKSQTDIDQILVSSNHSYEPTDLSLAIAKTLSIQKRDADWIRENGICLENILPGPSTNPFSSASIGKGAIAQRSMSKGDVIAPAPMLQITDRDALRMPPFKGDRMQLLLNYCFGRDDSSLLLCPNTNALLINHCSDRRPELHPCGEEAGVGPNAEYRWAEWDTSTANWLGKTIEEMRQEEGRGLSLEIVATRDIKEGEEVFIDYGEKWELAWDKHLEEAKSFSNVPSSGLGKIPGTQQRWKSMKELNDELAPLQEAKDLEEESTSTDSLGLLFTGCLYWEDLDRAWDDFEYWDDDIQEWDHLTLDTVIEKYATSADGDFNINESGSYADGSFWPCVVLKREQEGGNGRDDVPVEDDFYTVRILQSDVQEISPWEEYNFPRIIKNYPRASIRHFFKPYKSDIHLPNAFRHHIELNDEITPHHWKDRSF